MLNFDGAQHWLDLYRNRIARGHASPVQMLVCTKTAPAPERLPKGVPNCPGLSVRFIGRMIRDRLAMAVGF
jgi:hypothetical protein